jgi:fatty acid desaturase
LTPPPILVVEQKIVQDQAGKNWERNKIESLKAFESWTEWLRLFKCNYWILFYFLWLWMIDSFVWGSHSNNASVTSSQHSIQKLIKFFRNSLSFAFNLFVILRWFLILISIASIVSYVILFLFDLCLWLDSNGRS